VKLMLTGAFPENLRLYITPCLFSFWSTQWFPIVGWMESVSNYEVLPNESLANKKFTWASMGDAEWNWTWEIGSVRAVDRGDGFLCTWNGIIEVQVYCVPLSAI
jgi:hypothetical protein